MKTAHSDTEAAGISVDTLKRAKHALGLESKNIGGHSWWIDPESRGRAVEQEGGGAGQQHRGSLSVRMRACFLADGHLTKVSLTFIGCRGARMATERQACVEGMLS